MDLFFIWAAANVTIRCKAVRRALCGVALIFVGADAHISPIDHREGFCGNIMQP